MKNKNKFYYFTLLSQIGFVIMANILVCVLIYLGIEKFFGGHPLLLIFLVLLGVVSGFYSVYKMLF